MKIKIVKNKRNFEFYYVTDFEKEYVQSKYPEMKVWESPKGFFVEKSYDNFQKLSRLNFQLERELEERKYNEFLESKKAEFDIARKVKIELKKKTPMHTLPDSNPLLMNHQIGGTLIAEICDKFGFFYDTGTGKTMMALDIINYKEKYYDAHFLILCPKTIINTAWMSDCEKYYPKLRVLPVHNDVSTIQLQKLHNRWTGTIAGNDSPFFEKKKAIRSDKAIELMKPLANHIIVNYEMFTRYPEAYLNMTIGEHNSRINGIIVDESAVIKNPCTHLYSALQDSMNEIKYLYLLSGKPAPNKPTEYYSQIELLAPELKLPSKTKVEEKPQEYLSEFLENVAKVSLTVSKKDCFDLPETTEIVRSVDLNDKLYKKYEELSHSIAVELEDIEHKNSHLVFMNHVFSNINKLRQFSGGTVLGSDGPVHVHNYKLDELERVVDELGGEQAIIWCQYRHEVKAIENRLTEKGYSVVTAYSETKNKDTSINEFLNKRADFLIAHPKTLKYGVTLVNCTYAIYYSTSYSYEEYYQSHDRIYRKGQTQPCTYIFIQAAGTVDEIMYNAIMNKMNQSEMVEEFLKHVRSFT